jgi:hypothetical protein
MSSDDFFGPALPPGFVIQSNNESQDEMYPKSDKTRQKRGRSSESSGSSQTGTDHGSSNSDASDDDGSSSQKRSRSDSSATPSNVMGPALPPQYMGPALPPHTMGPALPPGFSPGGQDTSSSTFIGPVIPLSALTSMKSDDDEDRDIVGPVPGDDSQKHSAIDELEARAQHMKDKLLGKVVDEFNVQVMSTF